jgi:hypothetical protein
MHGKNQDGVCHVIRNKHKDDCMQNLKQKEDFNNIRRSKCFKPLFIGAKNYMKTTKKGDAFLIYVFPSLDGELHPREIPSHYKEFKYVFENKNVNTLSKH